MKVKVTMDEVTVMDDEIVFSTHPSIYHATAYFKNLKRMANSDAKRMRDDLSSLHEIIDEYDSVIKQLN